MSQKRIINNNRRVVITGFGIVSSLGNNTAEVLESLRLNRSGVEVVEEWKELNLKSFIAGTIKNIDLNDVKKEIGGKSRYMDVNSLYSMVAAKEATAMSELSTQEVASERTSCIIGNGLSSTDPIVRAGLSINSYKAAITPFDINRSMSSSCSANMAFYYGVKGRSYSISSACSTSLHNIGHSYEMIRGGISDTVLSGGAEEVSPSIATLFNGMRSALATMPEEGNPHKVSRPYDAKRNGFVVSGGGGVVILEDLEHALGRNAPIYAEVVGYGACSDGHDIIQPHPEGDGAYRCMKEALDDAGMDVADIDYINTHGTSTVQGDIAEAKAIARLTGHNNTPVSSTKALSGHGIGAAGVHELIYCLLMLNNNFITASANIEDLDPAFNDLNIVRQNMNKDLKTVMTNSFGFGGTNASIIIRKY